MDMEHYRALVAPLPAPSPLQQSQFVEHVCDAHSWYKHLPLRDGGVFLFFVNPAAGEGFSAEERRTHYGWKTTREYRTRFGFLDYAWRTEPDRAFSCDSTTGALNLELPAALVEAGTVPLYPYVSLSVALDEWPGYPQVEEVLESLRAGAWHSDREPLLRWYELHRAYERHDLELSEEQRDEAAGFERAGYDQGRTLGQHVELAGAALSTPTRRLLDLTAEMESIYLSLQRKERAKVETALAEVLRLTYGVPLGR